MLQYIGVAALELSTQQPRLPDISPGWAPINRVFGLASCLKGFLVVGSLLQYIRAGLVVFWLKCEPSILPTDQLAISASFSQWRRAVWWPLPRQVAGFRRLVVIWPWSWPLLYEEPLPTMPMRPKENCSNELIVPPQ